MINAPTSIDGAVELVLNQLRSALGTTENPDGSNHNFITDWYNKNVDKIGDGPWCQMTVTWSVWTAGYGTGVRSSFKALLTGAAWTVQAVRNAQKGLNGSKWVFGVDGMLPGDNVYFDWTEGKGEGAVEMIDHVGTVEKINGDGTFYALEGNCNNALRRTKRDAKYVVGYVRHDWVRVVVPLPIHTPHPVPAPISIETKIKRIQAAVGVTQDGVWGPVTDAAFLKIRRANTDKGAIKEIQAVVGVAQDGIWGPITDEAALTFRKTNLKR